MMGLNYNTNAQCTQYMYMNKLALQQPAIYGAKQFMMHETVMQGLE